METESLYIHSTLKPRRKKWNPTPSPLIPKHIEPEKIWELIVTHNKQAQDIKTINLKIPRENNKTKQNTKPEQQKIHITKTNKRNIWEELDFVQKRRKKLAMSKRNLTNKK